MNHLLDINDLSSDETMALIQRALQFKHDLNYPIYSQYTLANLFYEPSTRTRISFELAAHRLGMHVVNVDLDRSSESKGEVIEDTFATLMAIGIRLFVLRHTKEGLAESLAKQCVDGAHVVNAGDGQHAHPSQALLDVMTIIEKKPALDRLKIAIVGDIRHSRVANSLQLLLKLLGVGELVMVSPERWQPRVVHHGRVTSSLRDGLTDADVVICLRVQQERLLVTERLDVESYRRDYAVTTSNWGWAKQEAMLMHPGPVNRGIELDDEMADGPHSFILQQVTNGVFMRMAILEALIS